MTIAQAIAQGVRLFSGDSVDARVGIRPARAPRMKFVELEEARTAVGLRIVIAGGVPSPWSQGALGLFAMKGVEPLAARFRRAHADELSAWTGSRNAPVVAYRGRAAGGRVGRDSRLRRPARRRTAARARRRRGARADVRPRARAPRRGRARVVRALAADAREPHDRRARRVAIAPRPLPRAEVRLHACARRRGQGARDLGLAPAQGGSATTRARAATTTCWARRRRRSTSMRPRPWA